MKKNEKKREKVWDSVKRCYYDFIVFLFKKTLKDSQPRAAAAIDLPFLAYLGVFDGFVSGMLSVGFAPVAI